MAFIKTIKNIDFLSPGFTINYDNQSKSTSLFGVCMSVLVGIVGIMAMIFFSMELVLKENPISRVSREIIESSTITIEEFPFLFFPLINRASNPAVFFDNFVINAYQFNGSLVDPDVVNYKLIVELCKPEYIPNYSEQKSNLQFNQIFCINPNKALHPKKGLIDWKARIGLDTETRILHKIFVDIDLKKGKSVDVVSNYVSVDVSLLSLRSFVNVANYSTPVSKEFTSTLINISTSIVKATEFLFSVNKLTTDSGWLLSSLDNEYFIGSAGSNDFFGLFDPKKPMLANMFFTLDRVGEVYYREYIKIQTVFAQVGGIIKSVALIAQFLVNQYSSYILFKTIAAENKMVRLRNEGSESRIQLGTAVKQEVVELNFCKFLFSSTDNLNKLFCLEKTVKNAFDLKKIGSEIDAIKEKLRATIEERNHRVSQFKN